MSIYNHDGPVCGPGRYHGRHGLIRSLVTGVHSGRSFLVCGGPNIGRTSTLDQLTYTIMLRWYREPQALKLVPVRYDVRQAAAGGPKALIKTLWPKVTAAVVDSRVFGDGTPAHVPKVDLLRAEDPWAAFAGACAELWDRLSGTRGWCRWALFLENGDDLLTPEMDAAIDGIASLPSGEVGAPSAIVVTAGRMMREMLYELRSPLHFLRPMFLGVLRDAEAEQLIRVGFPEAEDAWVQTLMATTGKHPYLLQRVLAELETLGGCPPVESAISAVEPDAAALFEEIWHAFDLDRGVTYRGAYAAPEHALMQRILDSEGTVALKTAERDLGIKPLREYAEFLEYVGVVERVLRGDTPVFRAPCEMFNHWYTARVMR